MLIKNIVYLFNLTFIRGYANDLEISLSHKIFINNKNNFLKFDYNNQKKLVQEDIFYNLYIVKFINNVFTPVVKLFPEIFISFAIVLYSFYFFPNYFIITIVLVLLFVPIIILIAKQSTKLNKIIITNLVKYSEHIKHFSISKETYIINQLDDNYQNNAISILDKNKVLWKKIIVYNNMNRPIIEIFIVSIILFINTFDNLNSNFSTFFVVLLRLSQQIISISTNFSSVNNNKEITKEIFNNTKKSNYKSKLLIPILDNDSVFKFNNILNNKSGILVVNGKSGIGKSTAFKTATYFHKFYYKENINIEKIKFEKFKFITQTPFIYKSIIEDLELNSINVKDFEIFLKENNLLFFSDYFYNNNISGGQLILYNTLKYLFIFKDKNIIFDEPTNGLDKNTKDKLLKLIENHSINKICIIITHDSYFNHFSKLYINNSTYDYI
jgi:ABC-type transport system involved in cytochrome bd biosynthesis fused ATPase/permease subunit